MKKLIYLLPALLIFWACGQQSQNSPEEDVMEVDVVEEIPPVEVITDDPHVATVESSMTAMSNADIAGFTAMMSDNVVFYFNNGDSLAGKSMVQEWWQDRWDTEIESIAFDNTIWLSIDVNEPQNESVMPGEYVMSWFLVTAGYKTGKSMTQWVHMIFHFNEAGQVDWVNQFIDRLPIMQATSS